MKPLFSITVIARNEAITLPKRLGPSLKEFLARGGDVVLLDTGSTDDTVKIAQELGFRVVAVGDMFRVPIGKHCDAINKLLVRNNEPSIIGPDATLFDFAAARNYCASMALNDFVMIADCDEGFTTLDIDALNQRIERGVQRADVEYVHCHDANDVPLMRFKRGVFYDRRYCQWSGIVHEIIVDMVPVLRDDPPASECVLEHWQEPSGNRAGYLAGLAWDFYQHPDKDRQAHYLARELMYSRRYHSAIDMFNRHYDMNKWKTERVQSLIYTGDCYQYLGDACLAVTTWQSAFTQDPTRREALMKLAWHFYNKSEYQPAVAYAAAALTIPHNRNFYGDRLEHYRNEPHEILYVGLWWLGDKVGSLHHWQKAISFSPDNLKYRADAQFYT